MEIIWRPNVISWTFTSQRDKSEICGEEAVAEECYGKMIQVRLGV
jgi:hypothetical protein